LKPGLDFTNYPFAMDLGAYQSDRTLYL